jgi:hypothetical protein
MEIITIRLAPGFVRTVFKMRDPAASKPADNAAFGVQPQGYGLANRLAQSALGGSRFSLPGVKTLSLWRYRGRPIVTRHSGARVFARTRNPEVIAKRLDSGSARKRAHPGMTFEIHVHSRNRGHIAS